MSARVAIWSGGIVFAGVAVAMTIYFTQVGLEQADQAASVIGAFIAVASLGLMVNGVMAERRRSVSAGPAEQAQAAAGFGNAHNTISGGTFHGPVVQGRDVSGLPPRHPSPSGMAGDQDS
ncbi:hypothetical protein [Herbidospora cretacea]|uniref:hypothetical protein n=1 Tax=Herbidospora cretacea TaxID=28444 RepID=UPI0012DC59AE|nr:hypothetical protein [Herbidospora cretacea]